MADKKSLFAGRSGSKGAKTSLSPKKQRGNDTPLPTGPVSLSGEKMPHPLPFGRSGLGNLGKGVAATAQRREIQVKEAEDYLKQANKMLTKTLTRWNPDFFSAAPLFEKAGASYRAAGEDSRATAMYMQAGECHCHESVLAHASAAKDFREAALITERQKRKDEAAALYLRCAEAWVHADEPGRAAEYLGRSAKLVKDTDEDAAAERYVFASKVMVPEGADSRSNFTRVVGGVDILVQAIVFLASTNRLEKSLEVVSRYIIILEAEGMEHSLGRMYLTYCVLCLSLDDYVRADAAFRNKHLQSTAYLRSEECRVEEELLKAFKDYRPDLLEKVQSDRTLHRLETDIVRLAKSLRVPGFEGDEKDIIPARENPSGTIGAAQARARALKDKYGGGGISADPATKRTPSLLFEDSGDASSGGKGSVSPVPPARSSATICTSSPLPAPPPNPQTTSAEQGRSKKPAQASEDEDNDGPARSALFGGGPGRTQAPPPAPPRALGGGVSKFPAAAAVGSARSGTFPDLGESSEVDLDLGDLEASLGVGSAWGGGAGVGRGDDDDDDLEAMIEAARREAEALAMGGEGAAAEGESDDDEIDLT